MGPEGGKPMAAGLRNEQLDWQTGPAWNMANYEGKDSGKFLFSTFESSSMMTAFEEIKRKIHPILMKKIILPLDPFDLVLPLAPRQCNSGR